MRSLIRLNPLVAPIISRIIGSAKPETEVLQPKETEAVSPPFVLPGMLDRVTGTDEHSVLSHHLDAARATVATHAPVLRHTYRNALVRRTGFATWRYNERYGDKLTISELAGPILRVPELRYCHNYVSWRYFGHWLTDSIPSALIDPEQGALWMPPHPDWSDASDYLKVFNLSVNDAAVVHADQLTVYQDFGQGSHKRKRYTAIRNRLHSTFGSPGAKGCVYIRRGTTGVQRAIVNEAELIDQLTARNWQILDMATATVKELQQTLCRARIVVGMEGSHLTHAQLSLLPKSIMVILVPHDRFTTVHVGYCNAQRVSIGMVVLTGGQAQGYVVELDEVLKTVDLVEASAQF